MRVDCIPAAVVEADSEEDSHHILRLRLRLHLHIAAEEVEALADSPLGIHMAVEENEIVVEECCCSHSLVDW